MLKQESFKSGIVFSIIFTFISKLLSFGTSIAVAFLFGTSSGTDFMFFCSSTVISISMFIACYVTTSLVPEISRIREQHNEKTVQHTINFFAIASLLFSLLLLMPALVAPEKSISMFSHFPIATINLELRTFFLALPLIPMIVITLFITDILVSYRYFTFPMIVATINSITSLLCIVLLNNKFGYRSLIIGLLTGYSLNILFLFWHLKYKMHWDFNIISTKGITKKLLNNIKFAQLGSMSSTIASMIQTYLASTMYAGAVTSLNYGRQLSELPNLLISRQLTGVSAIKINELASTNMMVEIECIFQKTGKLLCYILIPLSTAIYICAPEIVSIFYKRGAFDINSVNQSALFLKWFIIFTPIIAIDVLSSRVYMAFQIMKHAFWIQISMGVATVITMIILVTTLGPIGIPIAMGSVYLISVLLQPIFYHRWIGIQFYPLIKYGMSLGIICAIIGFSCNVLLTPMRTTQNSPFIITILSLTYTQVIFILVTIPLGLGKEITEILIPFFKKSVFNIMRGFNGQ